MDVAGVGQCGQGMSISMVRIQWVLLEAGCQGVGVVRGLGVGVVRGLVGRGQGWAGVRGLVWAWSDGWVGVVKTGQVSEGWCGCGQRAWHGRGQGWAGNRGQLSGIRGRAVGVIKPGCGRGWAGCGQGQRAACHWVVSLAAQAARDKQVLEVTLKQECVHP